MKISVFNSLYLKILELFRNIIHSKRYRTKFYLIDFINQTQGIKNIQRIDNNLEFEHLIANSNFKFKLEFNTSDLPVFGQVFIEEEYRFIVDFLNDKNGKYLFLDIGANIGLTTLYLRAHFPNSRIVALEPEPRNFGRLKDHLELNGLNNVSSDMVGLFVANTTLYANTTFRDGESWSFRLSESPNDGDKFKVISLNSLLDKYNIVSVDLLKIDIEGGEKNLLENELFLEQIRSKVKVLMIEIHEEVMLIPVAKQILTTSNFICIQSASTLVCINKMEINVE